jgi:Holliday junction resolvase RusA-like endonuclease
MQDKIQELTSALYGEEAHAELVSQAVEKIGGLKPADLKRALAFIADNESDNGHEVIRFSVMGDPPVSKRPRSARIKNKATGAVTGIRVFAADADDQLSLKESVVRRLPAGHIPYAGEVDVVLEIFRPMLASWPPYKCLLAELGYVRPESKPDADNFAKIIVDAMRGVVFVDDGQIVNVTIALGYSVRPRLEVAVSGRKRRMNK